MSSPVNAPTTILPPITVSSTGGLTAQYESQGVTPKSGGRKGRRKSRRRTNKRTNKKANKKSNKRITFMTKWMGV